jgi:hypothetical protein
MSRFYRWSMRNGARILFMISLLLLLTGLWPVLYSIFSMTSEMSGSHYYTPELDVAGLQSQMLIQALINAVGAAALPFFGAVLIDRIDRRWGVDEKGAAPAPSAHGEPA